MRSADWLDGVSRRLIHRPEAAGESLSETSPTRHCTNESFYSLLFFFFLLLLLAKVGFGGFNFGKGQIGFNFLF